MDCVKKVLVLNGEIYKYYTTFNVLSLLNYLGFKTDLVVIDHNGTILQKEFNPERTDLILKLMILSATYELMFSHKTPVNVIVSEYVKISDFFLESAHKGYLNAILDKISQNFATKFHIHSHVASHSARFLAPFTPIPSTRPTTSY